MFLDNTKFEFCWGAGCVVVRGVLSVGDKLCSWDSELHLLLLRILSALVIRLAQVHSVSERISVSPLEQIP